MKDNLKSIFLLFVFLLVNSVLPVYGQEDNFRKRHNQSKLTKKIGLSNDEIVFGRDLAARILASQKLSVPDKTSRYVSLLGTGLAAQFGRSDLNFYFAVTENENISTMACPGGYVFISRGALKVLENEAQLVGLLAIQIVHINKNHLIKSVSDSFDYNSDDLEKSFQALKGNSISPEFRMKADDIALQILYTQGYSWESYKKMLEKINQADKDRITNLDNLATLYKFNDTKGKDNAERFKKYTGF